MMRLLRITIQKGSGPVTVKLEGKLAGPWVEELKNVWRSESATEAFWVDLFDVSFVDASGKDLLALMWQGGAVFLADSPLMKQVIEEVKRSPEGSFKVAHLTRHA
jgi:anti-anti-sigma regulatory factor